MTTFRLLSKASGVSKNTGKNWYRVYLRSDVDGESVIKDFFIDETVWNDMAKSGVSVDDDVFVSCSLDSKLHYCIDLIEKAN